VFTAGRGLTQLVQSIGHRLCSFPWSSALRP
jgi:hypothetical protein